MKFVCGLINSDLSGEHQQDIDDNADEVSNPYEVQKIFSHAVVCFIDESSVLHKKFKARQLVD